MLWSSSWREGGEKGRGGRKMEEEREGDGGREGGSERM